MSASESFEHGEVLQAVACPDWCEGEHLGAADDHFGFHHDGEVDAIALDGPDVPGRREYLYVNVSQLQQGDQEGRGHEVDPPYVEVQDAVRTLALLTPAESIRLAKALTHCAAVIQYHEGTHVT